jgi:peptidoglycan/xylan/chitin deacetylase (PgdA/CDA1 family)
VQAIEQRVLAQVTRGSIILSHDGGGPRAQTLAAYPYIIRQLRARGYRFVTVPQLLSYSTIYRRCTRNCEGAAIKGRPPRGSIVRT